MKQHTLKFIESLLASHTVCNTSEDHVVVTLETAIGLLKDHPEHQKELQVAVDEIEENFADVLANIYLTKSVEK